MIRYAKPRTVNEALSLLGEARWKMLAGGTDFYPAVGNRPIRENVLDINGLDELRGFSETRTHLVIGAGTTWSQILHQPLPPAFDVLKQAAREVGSVQIQNVATVGGNLCNASPAADGVPALMVLDAEVELLSRDGGRVMPLGDFVLGNRRTALGDGEILSAVRLPRGSLSGTSAFHKLGARRYLVISIAMAAARVVTDRSGKITKAAISVGACSEVAQRLPALEAALTGCRESEELERVVHAADLSVLSPIDDVRGSAAYRRAAAKEIIARALRAALDNRTSEVAA